MTQKKLNIGMIGAGFIGQIAHLSNYIEISDCSVEGLAEFRPQLRQKVAARYAIPHTYASHHQLLQNANIDAVIIVTPRQQTALVVRDCLNAGKHVFSEKPMAISAEEGAELAQLAREKGLRYCVGYMKRHDEGVQLAKKMLDELLLSQELGAVLFVRAHCYMGDSYCKAGGHVISDEIPDYPEPNRPIAPKWVPEHRRKDFADYVNTYSHLTNLLRYLFPIKPEIDYVSVVSPLSQMVVLNYGDFLVNLETGRSSNRDWDEVVEIYFTHGKLTITPPPALMRNTPAKVELYRAGDFQELSSPKCNWTWAFRNQANAFVADILSGNEFLTEGTDALNDLELIENIWKQGLRM